VSARPASRGLHRWRTWLQIVSLAVFMVLLTLTVWPLGQVFLGAFLVADPLIALNSAINGVVVGPLVGLAVLMLLAPLVIGRAFCGYVCPTGALIEWLGPDEGPGRLSTNARDALRKAPAFVLVATGGLFVFASGLPLLFDPLATLTRTATVLVYPLLDRLLRVTGDVAYLAPPLRIPVDYLNALASGRLIFARPLTYDLQLAVTGMAVAMVGASWLEPRLWCRHLCPLGALLGLTGRLAARGRTVDAEKCIACGRCEQVCPLDAVRDEFLATDTSRCQLCLACADVCPTAAIATGARPRTDTYLPERRSAVAAMGLALSAGFFGFTSLRRDEREVRLIRPPGARREDDVLALCSRCGQCMKVCPTNVLQPATWQAGPDGIFTPRMDYRAGQCEWSCNECGKVCPTGAIQALALPRKRRTVIGRAYVDHDRCYPWADGLTCLVCQELCPLPEKAIIIDEGETIGSDGTSVKLGRPKVVPERCIGCGVCEHVCPVPHESAIIVNAVGRERRTS
jgi:MauM/NapG family ferredoxin protein